MMNNQAICLVMAAWCVAGCSSTGPKGFGKSSAANVFVSDQKAGQSIRKVALMPFKAPTELIGSSVSDLFVTDMLRTGRYELVERSQMGTVLGESELALSGLTLSEMTEVARMAGAEGVIVGSVIEYQTQAVRGHAYPVVGISARLIDTQSGRIVWSADMTSRAKSKKVALSQHARSVVRELTTGIYHATRN